MNGTVGTDQFSNMNMDCISLTNEPEKGQYLIAVGQDKVSRNRKQPDFHGDKSVADGWGVQPPPPKFKIFFQRIDG